MIVIDARKLVKIYLMGDQKVYALKGVSVKVEKGEFLSITGTSGSGKTTLMHLLGCLDKPTSGEYFLDQKDVSKLNRDQLARIRNKKIGFVFQKFYLLGDLTALDNVALPQLYANVPESKARAKAKKLLEMVDLGKRLNHYPNQLSGGQQQRVAIARALINDPDIILADEPTGNLDTHTGDTIMDLFRSLNRKKNVTTIIVTHEPDIAAKTDRIVQLSDGEIISDRKVQGDNNE